MLRKNVVNDLSDSSASWEICAQYPTAINVLHAANRFSDILSLMACSDDNKRITLGWDMNQYPLSNLLQHMTPNGFSVRQASVHDHCDP
ncbi:hypothetical protein AVEN_254286-1 [Araneus ventricosus]|uniref:Uncharacterized protein n=1 Tax=Araneus ventricosus TaxID=182803 RepID=A0A4Y2FBK0_ARAVE|nr:hypothetical protein AVEN_254286-1 [Araneus ventricosus]